MQAFLYLKNWKSLFVKTEEEPEAKPAPAKSESTGSPQFSFPVGGGQPAAAAPAQPLDPSIQEVIRIYEAGLESINMPGYDFYEFYQSVSSTGQGSSEPIYKMALQMARTLDKAITPGKLLQEAEFYISKINEVHSQYQNQGQQKIATLQETKRAERQSLTQDIDQATAQINQLKQQIQKLEQDVAQKRQALGKLEESSFPAEKAIRDKLSANDMARQTSVDRLNLVKDGISRFLMG